MSIESMPIDIALPEEFLVMADLLVSFDLSRTDICHHHLDASSHPCNHVNSTQLNIIVSVTYDDEFITPHY